MTRRSSRSSRRSWAMAGLSRHEDLDRVALALEGRLVDVAQILAVDLERLRLRTANLEPVEVVPVEDSWHPPAEDARDGEPRDGPGPNPPGRDEIEAALEPGFGREAQRQ